MLHTKHQNLLLNSKMRTFKGSEDILTGSHNFKGLLEG